jgi:hypothetical protein
MTDGLRVLFLMEVHAGRAENITAHLTGFRVGLAQIQFRNRALLVLLYSAVPLVFAPASDSFLVLQKDWSHFRT